MVPAITGLHAVRVSAHTMQLQVKEIVGKRSAMFISNHKCVRDPKSQEGLGPWCKGTGDIVCLCCLPISNALKHRAINMNSMLTTKMLSHFWPSEVSQPDVAGRRPAYNSMLNRPAQTGEANLYCERTSLLSAESLKDPAGKHVSVDCRKGEHFFQTL